jgi:cytochrome o ubiquinol oxidase subunit 2
MNKEGDFTGISGHYSGAGFSRMNFGFKSLSQTSFDEWVTKAKSTGRPLNRDVYLSLEKPSEAVPVQYYASVENGLYDAILGLCVAPGQMCVHEMHHIDRMGGTADGSEANRLRLDYDNRRLESGDEPSGATFPASGRSPRSPEEPEGVVPRGQNTGSGDVGERRTEPNRGPGNAPPGADTGPAPAQLNTQPSQPHRH